MYNTENGAAILRESAYDKGYKDGVICGKLCASLQILDELEEALIAKREEYKQNREADKATKYPEAVSYWLGRGLTCGNVLRLLTELKKKYGVG